MESILGEQKSCSNSLLFIKKFPGFGSFKLKLLFWNINDRICILLKIRL